MRIFLRFLAFMSCISTSSFINAAPAGVPIYQVGDVEGNFIQVPLSYGIYRYSNQPDLRDLTVLDSEQNPLPYRLVSVAAANEKAAPQINSQPLSFYPVAADTTRAAMRNLHTQIKLQGDDIQINTGVNNVGENWPEFYLIDVSKLDHDIDGLRVEWELQPNNQYLQLQLEASLDLQNWHSYSQHTLVQIQNDQQNIIRNFINIPLTKKQYEFLRIKILRGAENLKITSIKAEQIISDKTEHVAPTESWSLKGVLAKDQNTVYLPTSQSKTFAVAAWEFNRDESTPTKTFDISVGETAYGDSVKIFSRSDLRQNWTLRYQGIWFNAQVGEQWQKSDAVNTYRNTDKYWRVEFNENVREKLNPQLVFTWEPTELQIISNGKSPYFLAINQDNSDSYTRAEIFNHMISAFTPTWTRGNLISLDTKPEVVADLKNETDWKQWIFWAALLSAVAVLLIFAARLFRQLKSSNLG